MVNNDDLASVKGFVKVYCIRISIDNYKWTVEHRYSDFVKFDAKRFEDRKKSFLPPKKLVGNMDPEFLEERRIELEKYILTVVELELWLLKKRKQFILPRLLARFLDFHQYEVHSIVEDLSLRLGVLGEKWLEASLIKPKFFEFKPIELFALSERLKLAEPSFSASSNGNGEADIANYVEFLHKARALKIRGSSGYVNSSNILHNDLPVSLHLCKSLLALWIAHFDVKKIKNLTNVKKTCRRLIVHYSMKKLSDLLLNFNSGLFDEDLEKWNCIEYVDFSFNELIEIDNSITVLQGVSKLNFSYNNLRDIGESLQYITTLAELCLTGNMIRELHNWNLKLGNIKKLFLCKNKITSVQGLERLLSLEYLDLSDNIIAEPSCIQPIGKLPCLEHLVLRGNPIRQLIEYRTKVIESFDDRAAEVYLDGKRANQRELDTISVRLALKKIEKEKEEMQRRHKEEMNRRLNFSIREMSVDPD